VNKIILFTIVEQGLIVLRPQ